MKQTIILFFVCNWFIGNGQERLEIRNLGFSIDKPSEWMSFSDKEVIENLENFDFTDKQMNYFVKSHSKVLSISTFTKYDPKKHFGIIPTIKISMYPNAYSDSKEFLNYVSLMNEGAKKQLNDFVIVKQPTLEQISGHDVVNSSYHFKLKRGNVNYSINTNTYYIARGKYFITLNFIEEINVENNMFLFENLIKSIQLSKL